WYLCRAWSRRRQSPLFSAREGRIHERFVQMELASLMQMFAQQAKRLNELALANPLLEPPVAGLIRRILRRHLGPLRTTAENTQHAVQNRPRVVPGTA